MKVRVQRTNLYIQSIYNIRYPQGKEGVLWIIQLETMFYSIKCIDSINPPTYDRKFIVSNQIKSDKIPIDELT